LNDSKNGDFFEFNYPKVLKDFEIEKEMIERKEYGIYGKPPKSVKDI
jgi:hypothetical protein